MPPDTSDRAAQVQHPARDRGAAANRDAATRANGAYPREQALVDAAKAQRLLRPDLAGRRAGGLQVADARADLGVYGSQRIYNGAAGNPHFMASMSRCRRALRCMRRLPASSRCQSQTCGFSGGTIILDHGFRFSSAFLHMSKVLVKVGQEVQTGDKVIGEVGATGRASGPHLDWRMSWRNERIDPQLLAPPMPKP